MNNIRHLNKLMVFAAVAQKGSFTQAAQLLGITKSAASQHIRQLESAMGIRVLNRSTRGVSLTALGEKLLLRCQLLEDHVEQVFAEITNASGDPQGRFAVTFPHSLEMGVVLPALEQLCNEYPRLEPVLIASDNTLDLIANQLDVALHVGALPDSGYRAIPVGTMTEIFLRHAVILKPAHHTANTGRFTTPPMDCHVLASN
ncbi:LysR family transcriptional regulator [Methylocucumis oryzae]|uniref:LysR family transcriptional regulator n=1 Tax=Methylocucumis oryzae TaxID=1632867 RepID=UPI0019553493|nr:LysR family transcriptional regulator [Methylocucumis oryzae]